MAVTQTRRVGIVVERRRIASPWQDHVWRVVALLTGEPEAAPWTVLTDSKDCTRWFAGTAEIVLHDGEAETYRYNLDSPEPAVYVILRRDAAEPGLRLLAATVDPGEADIHADAGDDLMEALPMPPEIVGWVADFVARHPGERTFYKRRRDRADPEALARGRHWKGPAGALPPEEDEA